MCEPVTLGLMAASTAVSLAGGAMSANAQRAQISQQNAFQQMMQQRNKQMRAEELARQEALRKQQEGIVNENNQNYTADARQKQLQQSEAEIEQNVNQLKNDVAAETSAVPSLIDAATAGNVVAEGDYAKRLATAAADSRKRIQALAKMGAYDMSAGNRAMMGDENAARMNLLNNFRKGSLDVSGVELGLNNGVAQSTVVGPQTNMLAAGQMISGIGNAMNSAISGGGAQKAIGKFFG